MKLGMTTTGIAVVCCVFLIAGTAMADSPLPNNAFGLYFDSEQLTRDIDVTETMMVDLYLVFTAPTAAAISGWQAAVTISGGITISESDFPSGSQATLKEPGNFTVAMDTPLPCTALTKLAVFRFTAQPDIGTSIYLGNVSDPRLVGDLPSIQLTDGSWESIRTASGDPSSPAAFVNLALPTEASSWGSLKSLYR